MLSLLESVLWWTCQWLLATLHLVQSFSTNSRSLNDYSSLGRLAPVNFGR